MKTPIFVRPLSEEERESLQKGLRSKDTFTMRRSQMLLASSRGERAPKIALNLGAPRKRCATPSTTSTGGAFSPSKRSPRARRGPATLSSGRAPRSCGRCSTALRESSDTRRACGLLRWPQRRPSKRDSPKSASRETVRATLSRLLGVRWMREKRWITSPDPLYERKKASFASDRLMEVAGADPEWAVGFLDECWWSRVALPTLNAWAEEGKPPRLIRRSVAKDDPEPKAISCYGLYLPALDRTWIRFVDGRPVSSITTRFLEWSVRKLEAVGKKVLVLIWDNASWHVSKAVRG